MSAIGDFLRFARLLATLKKNGALDPVMRALSATPRLRAVVSAVAWPLQPFGLAGEAHLPPAARSLNALGPSYVKFGQILSTRADITGRALGDDLKELQDNLPPFAEEEARRTVEAELGAPVSRLFLTFGPPVAAASIAQVHPATTRDGAEVAVKVLRPGIEAAFARDISAFYRIARLIEIVDRRSRRLKPTMVVQHFEGVVRREMDMRLEAAAGSEFYDNVKNEAGFRVPRVVWDLTAKRVLTTSWVEGVRMRDLAAIRARGFAPAELAKRLVRVFLRTTLRDGYFHADLHHGNLKVAPDGAVVAFDFGIMGRIDEETRRAYAEILLSYLTRDYHRGARAHFEAGYVPPTKDPVLFAQALRSIGEPIVGRRAGDIHMERVLKHLFEVTEEFGMETREELLLLQRSMVAVEGVARSLDADFDMWSAARPEVEAWMVENIGPRAILNDVGRAARTLTRLGPRLPRLAERLIAIADGAPLPVSARVANAASPSAGSEAPFWRGVLAGALGAGLLLGAYLLGAASGGG